MWAVKDQLRVYFGSAGDVPVPGDYNGNSIDDIAIFRPYASLWAIKDQTRIYYGKNGDIPLVR